MELGVRSPNVSVLLVSFVPFLLQLCYDSCWDFNVHNQEWLHSSRTTRGVEHAEDTCYMHGVEQVVVQPPHGCNTLDQMMTDLPVESFVSVLPPFGKSDHACLLADFQIRASRKPPISRTVWRYQHADWARLRHLVRTTNWAAIAWTDPDLSCTGISERILEGMKRFIPSNTLKTCAFDPPWWTPECTATTVRK